MQKSASQESTVLAEQEFDQFQPGSIIADFEMLLDAIGVDGVKTGGKNHRIPLAMLKELDERMTHPLRPNLQRPNQLSFPHLNGLYLLLRNSGLVVAQATGAYGRLSINPDRLAEWRLLNPVEQYFTLLHTLLTSSFQVVDSTSRLTDGPLRTLGWFRHSLFATQKSHRVMERRYDWKEQAVIALMELFGILDVPRGMPKEGENWRIEDFRTTPFGKVLMSRVYSDENSRFILDLAIRGGSQEDADQWLGTLFQDVYPDCQKTFTDAEQEFREGVWQFKVSLGKVWRRIIIPAELSVDDLICTILNAFNFDNDHLYDLKVRDRLGRSQRIEHPECGDGEYFTDDFAIGSLPLGPGQSGILTFDYGDNWQFTVKFEELLPEDRRLKKAKVTAKQGNPPPQYPGDDDDEDFDDLE